VKLKVVFVRILILENRSRTKFQRNRPCFVEDITKTFWLTFFVDTVYMKRHLSVEGENWIMETVPDRR